MPKKSPNVFSTINNPGCLQHLKAQILSFRHIKPKMADRYDCHYCKESLFGKKYVLRDENPYCVKCYESLYSNTCEECKKPIGCNSRVSFLQLETFMLIWWWLLYTSKKWWWSHARLVKSIQNDRTSSWPCWASQQGHKIAFTVHWNHTYSIIQK